MLKRLSDRAYFALASAAMTVALVILMAACANQADNIRRAESFQTVLFNAATAYAKWPECGSAGATALCSEPSIKAEIRKYAISMHDATVAARTAADDPNADNDVVKGLVAAALAAQSGLASLIPAEAAAQVGLPANHVPSTADVLGQ